MGLLRYHHLKKENHSKLRETIRLPRWATLEKFGVALTVGRLDRDIQSVPPTHEHLSPGMELDNESSNNMEMGPADAELLIRNAQELNGESTRSDFLRNYKLCPDV
jgi:hypothetical protein